MTDNNRQRVRVGVRRRLIAFACCAGGAAAVCVLFVEVLNGSPGTSVMDIGIAFLLSLAFVVIGGATTGLVVDWLAPDATGSVPFVLLGGASGAVTAPVLLSLLFPVAPIWTVPAAGAIAGLTAAVIWWPMVRRPRKPRERNAHG